MRSLLLKCFVAITFGFGLASASQSSDLTWIKLTASADGEYASYLDTDSIQPMGKGSWAMWVRSVYKTPKRDGMFSHSFSSEQRRYIVRCDDRTMATVARSLYDAGGAAVKQENWPESKWEFQPVGPKGGTNNIEYSAMCSIVLIPKPRLDFGEAGQWYPIEQTVSSAVDAASLQRVGDIYLARIRVVQNEDRRIGDKYYRTSYSYQIGNCKDSTAGTFAFALADKRGEIVESGFVPFDQVRMESVQSAKLANPEWFPICANPGNSSSHSAAQSGASGSGFFVSKEGHVLTNSHVASGCKALTVRDAERVTVEARLVGEDKKNDLALLQVNRPTDRFAVFRQQPLEIGEQVYAFGFPLSGVLSSGGNGTAGIVSGLTGLQDDTSKIQISAPVQPGNSGGPLFDGSGAISGVVVEKLNAMAVAKAIGDVPQNVNFAIKHSTAMAFLDSLGVRYQVQKAPAPVQPTAIFSNARQVSVFVECNR